VQSQWKVNLSEAGPTWLERELFQVPGSLESIVQMSGASFGGAVDVDTQPATSAATAAPIRRTSRLGNIGHPSK
jgi:hypothetical protein